MTRSPGLDYYELEGVHLDRRPPVSLTSRIVTALSGSWAALWATLLQSIAPSGEPVIETRRDRQGQSFYAIYDPSTQQRLTYRSEAEVRQWIEQRYRA